MEHSANYIRLFIATATALVSVVFAALYSFLMTPIIRDRVHHVVQQPPFSTYCFEHYAWYALVVPLSCLMVGITLLHRKKTGIAFELAVGFQWLFALLWLACCLLVWLLPELSYGEFIR